MSRLFISHSSKNDDWAIALRDWLVGEGWGDPRDIFLDLDPERGIAAGQKWMSALEEAATRCEAVLFLISSEWLASKWCYDEYQLANKLNKKLFALLIDDIALSRLPGALTAQWQIVRLYGDPVQRFLTTHPITKHSSPVYIAEAGLKTIKRGLEKAGIGAETFELQPDSSGTFGWRSPYRGLEPLEPEDAAVFFGRGADMVRCLDTLRGLAAGRPPRLLVILGASGAGKSSFVRAGLYPRLMRDDGNWIPFRALRAGRGGVIEGGEGLLTAIEQVQRRIGIETSRAILREKLATPSAFVTFLRDIRRAAARRALLSQTVHPLPVICLDQGEEVFGVRAEHDLESAHFLKLIRYAIDNGEVLFLVTIRSDFYGLMQGASALKGIYPTTISLGPVLQGEIANLIRAPAAILRAKAGPKAPMFDAAVVERLQAEVEGEADALPLLAFAMQRLMREHAGTASIGIKELNRTGGVAVAIEMAAEAALTAVNLTSDRTFRREALRRLFIPRLARVDPETLEAQRRIANRGDIPSDLLPLTDALTERRLLVVKAPSEQSGWVEQATIEVAHDALLRRWPTLVELLREDRDALLLSASVLLAAADWAHAASSQKVDFLVHRGSRLRDALSLARRGPEWEGELAPSQTYLAASLAQDVAEREAREASVRREQVLRRRWKLSIGAVAIFLVIGLAFYYIERIRNLAEREADNARFLVELSSREKANRELQTSLKVQERALGRTKANLFARLAALERGRGNFNGALRLAVLGTRYDSGLYAGSDLKSEAAAELAKGASFWGWQVAYSLPNARIGALIHNSSALVTITDSAIHVMRAPNGNTSAWEFVDAASENVEIFSTAVSSDGSRVFLSWRAVDKYPELDSDGRKSWQESSYSRIFDSETGKYIDVPVSAVRNAYFSGDGKSLLTETYDNVVIWDLAAIKEIFSESRSSTKRVAALSRDARAIVQIINAKANIIDRATRRIVSLKDYDLGVDAKVSFALDDSSVLASSSKRFAVWNAKTGNRALDIEEEGVSRATLHAGRIAGHRCEVRPNDRNLGCFLGRADFDPAGLPRDGALTGRLVSGERIGCGV